MSSDSGPDRIRAAIERDRGMYAPTLDEMRALTGCCTPPEGFVAQPQPQPQRERLTARIADSVLNALVCPACIRLRFGVGHLLLCDGGRVTGEAEK